MKRKIMLATRNEEKKSELSAILKSLPYEVFSLADAPKNLPIVVENGKTFRQNAVKKAVTISKFFDGLVLADDSGLEVAALEGKPGVRSARFARARATDQENNQKLLALLARKRSSDRAARFVCCIAVAKNGLLLGTAEGVVTGHIADKPRGRNGFGYDPLFIPEESQKTFAEIAPRDKNRISHRFRALQKAVEIIKEYS